MSELIYAGELFQQYRNRANLLMQEYNTVRAKFPYSEFPELIRVINFNSSLAEMWGIIATKVAEKPYWEENQ